MSEGGESPGADRQLLRLVPRSDGFFSGEGRPTRLMFEPSSQDEAQPPVRVSVWDYAVVDAARAQALRADGKLREGWSVTTTAAAEVSTLALGWGRPPLTVACDPDGASGECITDAERQAHHGVEGLSKNGADKNPAKSQRKAVLTERVCFPS